MQQQLSEPVETSSGKRPLLEIIDLRTHFRTDEGLARAVDGISFSLDEGRTLAVVGESGCGKTVTALSILRLLPMPPGEFAGGKILLDGRNLIDLPANELHAIRGGDVAMIFQEPGTSLNPVFTIGNQIAEAILLHRKMSRSEARREVIRVLKEVRMSEPERRIHQYPHELSGGMKQRAMIAMALSCNPRLLIADEPTTALDVTIQARILDLLRATQAEHGMAVLLITHDLGVVAEMADDVVVMYAGRIVERANVKELFATPAHPYTHGLFRSLPRIDHESESLEAIEGSVPLPTNFPSGCRFKDRCYAATAKCLEDPPYVEVSPGHTSACWYADKIARGSVPKHAKLATRENPTSREEF